MQGKKRFSKKVVGSEEMYTTLPDILRNMSWRTGIRIFVVFLCIGLVLWFSQHLIAAGKFVAKAISKQAVTMVSDTFGTGMQQDAAGNINVLLIGFGGDQHAGGHLADTIIAASFNPKQHTVSMVSVPRDLYIYEKGRFANRINAVFAFEYSSSQGDLDSSAKILAKKVGDILGVTIPYYALVDFKGFEAFVDSIGGIEIDVPYTLHDTQYPDPSVGHYVTFRLDPGVQTLDGATALKYARSRHSTSDFSRSQRQQLIIKGAVDKMLRSKTVTSPSALKELYAQYTKMVYTNVSAEEIVGMLKYAAIGTPQLFSFGLTMECSDMGYKTIEPGCLLYNPERSLFNDMSVLLPRGATANNPSFFDYTQFFGYMVMENPGYLPERANIAVYNTTDPDVARQYKYRNGLATKLAGKLKRYGFTVLDATNGEDIKETTTVVIPGTGRYEQTIKMLRLFLDFQVQVDPILDPAFNQGTGDVQGTGMSDEMKETEEAPEQKPTMVIYLGNDFIRTHGNKEFDMYKK